MPRPLHVVKRTCKRVGNQVGGFAKSRLRHWVVNLVVNGVGKRIEIVIALSLLPLILYFYVFTGKVGSNPLRRFILLNKEPKFLVATPTCHIPDEDPFDPSLRDFRDLKRLVPTCDASEGRLFRTRGNSFIADAEEARRLGLSGCVYSTVRGQNVSVPIAFDVEDEVTVNSTFVVVECHRNHTGFWSGWWSGGKNSSKLTSLLWLRYRDPVKAEEKSAIKATRRRERESAGESDPPSPPFNVHFLLIDGTSRLNSIRFLPATRKFLEDREAVEFLGFTKVGCCSLRNVFPMLTGKFHRSGADRKMVRSVWREMATRHGFWTLLVDDWALCSKDSFDFSAADYDWTALLRQKYSGVKWCLEGKMSSLALIDLFERIVDTHRLKEDSLFSALFMINWSHDDQELLSLGDEPMERLFRRLEDQGELNRSVVLLISDHGPRFGSVIKSRLGRYEQRHPLFLLLFPSWFRRRFPQLVDAARINSRRLTTPFDVHATLRHLLHLQTASTPWREDGGAGVYSLMTEITSNRTCDSAWIPDKFCGCRTKRRIDARSDEAVGVAQVVVEALNRGLRPFANVCSEYRLYEVREIDKTIQGDKEMWEVVVVVEPRAVTFAGLVRRVKGLEMVAPFDDIQRLEERSCWGCGRCAEHLRPELKKKCTCSFGI